MAKIKITPIIIKTLLDHKNGTKNKTETTQPPVKDKPVSVLSINEL